ncbi:MAG: DNA repair protein RadC [Deltaproteobacteria bacterium]|nr:DNA repair protein RadC [Deltaproteobacteria bacterium]
MSYDIYSCKEHRKRLKERFKKNSLETFHSSEVVELLLSFTVPKKDVRVLSKALIQKFKSLRGIVDAPAEELKALPGIGENAALLIKLIKNVSGVYLKEHIVGSDVIHGPRDVLNYLKLTLSSENIEKFLAIYLNSRNEAIAIEVLHEGTINQTTVYPRKAIELAFRYNARSVIFVHNHPSGDPTPSEADRQLTKALDRASFAVDLIVHDHLVIGRNRHFSAREHGWIMGHPMQLPKAASR